jgi:hypothetical protein
MSSTHRSVQQASLPFPATNGDRDFRAEFDAPALTGDFRRDRRPYISYMASPSSEPVHLEISINDTRVVNETFRSTSSRTMTQIIEHGVLKKDGNILEVLVPDSEPGSVTISNIVVVYSEDAA